MTRRPRATRRGFLVLAGSAALGGCSRSTDSVGDDAPRIDGGELRAALSTDPPTVAETLPVDVEDSRLTATAASARDRLSSVPAPFDEREVPNGAIREELARMHERATGALDDARRAETPAETTERLREARECVRAVAAAWEAVDDGLTRADVAETLPEVRDDVDAFRGRWRYVGGEPVRTVLAHGAIEELVASAANRTRDADDRVRRRPENPMTVGEFAGRVERARAALDDADYLFERYVDSLDDPGRVGDGLRAAGAALTETLDERREALPDGDARDASSFVDRDVEGTPVASALTDLYRGVEYADGLDDERATGRRASVVLSAHETLVRVRAFESLRERVADGDSVTVESADDVRAVRDAAVRAVEEAAASDADPGLVNRVLAQVAGGIGYADDRLDGYARDGEEVAVERIDGELGRYVLAAAMAEATPAASAAVADVVRRQL